MTKACVVGLWHLGCVTSACLSDLGYDVIGIDNDNTVVKGLQHGNAPLFEPGLDELIKKNIDCKRLRFTSDIKQIADAEYVLLTIDTPVDDHDMVDLNSVHQAIHEIATHVYKDTTIIIQSQVPVGTCDDFIIAIKKQRPDLEFGLAYCPENLRLGKAIEVFQKPDRIIIGVNDDKTANKVRKLFDVINCPKMVMDLKSAEMTKHSINAFLATCISFINWVGMICDEVGADPKMVSEGLMSEQRIGTKLPLRPGLGFAGGTLGRDLRILEQFSNEFHIKPNLMEYVLTINHQQNISVVKKLLKTFKNLDGLKIGIMGLTYKAGTSTLRRSTSLEIINELLTLGADVRAHDPSILSIDTIHNEKFHLCTSSYEMAEGTSALLIFTDWPEFRDLDYSRIFTKMKQPIIFDMKNFLNKDKLKDLGFDFK